MDTKTELLNLIDEWSYDLDDPFNNNKSKTHINAQGMSQGTCIHFGNCYIGCPVQAKNTLDLNYIPKAEKHGAVIKPLHLVHNMTPLDESGYRVDFSRINIDNNHLIKASLNAKKVIIASGTMGSNEYKSLTNISDQLGKGWSSNGDFITPAKYSDKDVSPSQGPTISCAIDF